MLALADGSLSSEEEEHLSEWAGRMKLPAGKTNSIHVWVHDYGELLERFDGILGAAELRLLWDRASTRAIR